MKRLLSFLPLFAVGVLVAAPAAKDKGFVPIDIQKHGNKDVTTNFAGGSEENVLKGFPTGEATLGEVKFVIGKKLVLLGSTAQKEEPAKVEGIAVGRAVQKLHFLHANGYGGGPNKEGSDWFVKDGTPIGEYTVRYEDKSSVSIPIVYGDHTRDWFYTPDEKEPAKAKVVWSGENPFAESVGSKVRVYLMSWDNPHPDKKVVAIDYSSKKDETPAAPFCIAITAEVK
jgi:hypothetical protein